MNTSLEDPSIVRNNFLVVIFVNPNFFETMALVKPLSRLIRSLDVKIYSSNCGFCSSGCKDEFKAL